MSGPLGLLGPTVLRRIAVPLMLTATAWVPPASAQRASLLQGPLAREALTPACAGNAPALNPLAVYPGALRDQVDSIHRGDRGDTVVVATPGESPESTPDAVAVMAPTPPMAVTVGAKHLAVLVLLDTDAVGRVHGDSTAAARHPGRTRFWRFAHVGMAVGAAAGLGYGLSQAPRCACGYFLGGRSGMVVSYTGVGMLFGFDGASVAYLADRLVRQVAKHARNP